MRIKPIEPPLTTLDLLVLRLTNASGSCQRADGELLPCEIELEEQLQGSRPILRETLARWQTTGLLAIQRWRGTFVDSATSLANRVRLSGKGEWE